MWHDLLISLITDIQGVLRDSLDVLKSGCMRYFSIVIELATVDGGRHCSNALLWAAVKHILVIPKKYIYFCVSQQHEKNNITMLQIIKIHKA